jgi:hypothetical protein
MRLPEVGILTEIEADSLNGVFNAGTLLYGREEGNTAPSDE